MTKKKTRREKHKHPNKEQLDERPVWTATLDWRTGEIDLAPTRYSLEQERKEGTKNA